MNIDPFITDIRRGYMDEAMKAIFDNAKWQFKSQEEPPRGKGLSKLWSNDNPRVALRNLDKTKEVVKGSVRKLWLHEWDNRLWITCTEEDDK